MTRFSASEIAFNIVITLACWAMVVSIALATVESATNGEMFAIALGALSLASAFFAYECTRAFWEL